MKIKKTQTFTTTADFSDFVSGYSYLSEDKLLLIIDRIESVCWYDFCAHLFPDGVSGQSIHVYFHIGTHFLIWQKLSRYNLKQTLHFYDWIMLSFTCTDNSKSKVKLQCIQYSSYRYNGTCCQTLQQRMEITSPHTKMCLQHTMLTNMVMHTNDLIIWWL